MNDVFVPPSDTEKDDAALDAILRAGSKTFHLASRALPGRIRRPTLALYAFCRHADDAVDDAADAARARLAVEALRARIDRVYAGRALDSVVERAFSRVVHRYGIPRSEPELLAEGMEWDVAGRTYRTLDDVRAYAARVAGSVGVMMTYIMGRSEPDVLERARDLGLAMQLTNIARDVGDDARMKRVYLPEEWLVEEGSSATELLASPAPTPAVRRTVARLLAAADAHYVRADEGIAHLPIDCRVAIRAARLTYAEIGRVVEGRNYDSVTARAVVPLSRKLVLLGRSFGAAGWRPHPLESSA